MHVYIVRERQTRVHEERCLIHHLVIKCVCGVIAVQVTYNPNRKLQHIKAIVSEEVK